MEKQILEMYEIIDMLTANFYNCETHRNQYQITKHKIEKIGVNTLTIKLYACDVFKKIYITFYMAISTLEETKNTRLSKLEYCWLSVNHEDQNTWFIDSDIELLNEITISMKTREELNEFYLIQVRRIDENGEIRYE